MAFFLEDNVWEFRYLIAGNKSLKLLFNHTENLWPQSLAKKNFLSYCMSFKIYLNYLKLPTLPISLSFVNMTIIVELCSHNILQKSSVVSARGPCVPMYAFLYRYPYGFTCQFINSCWTQMRYSTIIRALFNTFIKLAKGMSFNAYKYLTCASRLTSIKLALM